MKNMKDFYKKHKKHLIVGWAVLTIVLIAALFAGSALFGSKRGGVGYNMGAPAGLVGKTAIMERSAPSMQFVAEDAMISPPFPPEVPASGVIDPSIERKIIRNASVDMVVKNTEKAIEEIKNVAAIHKGVVSNSTVWESGDEKRGNISIRVPSEVFFTALESIRGFAVRVTREDINARDVTEEFIDLEAQLKNFKSVEQQYLKVLNRAYTVEDILAVRKELDRVRGDIERMQGRINYLSRQISMSTISVSLTSEADVKIFGIVWSPWLEVKAGVRDMFTGLIGFVNTLIALVFKLPILILWVAIILAVIWGGWRGIGIIKKKF